MQTNHQSLLASIPRFAASVAIILLASCGGGDSGGSSPTGGGTGEQPGTGAATATVKYTVSGSTDSASLTYENDQGGTVQQTVPLPWSVSYTMKDADFLYISAQNQNAAGSVTTEIRINGYLYKTTTSTGGYVIATASGSCC